MKIEGNVITLEAGEEICIKAKEKEVEPTPEPTPQPEPEPEPTPEQTPTDGRLTFGQLLEKFNEVLTARGYQAVQAEMAVHDYLKWANGFTSQLYDEGGWMFSAASYPLVYDYRGKDASDDGTAYNALTAWLMAMELAELVPDSGETTNTQTKLFKLAYELGGGLTFPLYNQKALKADPYAMRDVAGVMYAICRGDGNIAAQIDNYRSELGGREIPAATWDDLGYQNEMLTDEEGRRGYTMTYLGYAINSREFLPDAPGPRVEGTTVCELPLPYEQGQPTELFNLMTQNYQMDEIIYNEMVKHWNMMSQTTLDEWEGYSTEKQNRLVNVAAVPPCTKTYMFSRKNVTFDGIQYKSYDGQVAANYFCFSETSEKTGLALDGPFADLHGIYRYNALQRNEREVFLDSTTDMADNMRFALQDPNYGRCRPGCKNTRQGGERNPEHGAAENEIYNIDLCAMVADTAEQRAKMLQEDGFAADSPRSYVSGHSAQIWCLALAFIQMNNEGNCEEWVRKAYEYSVNRSIGRFHWMSDCVYGRLFGSMTLPIVNAMSGMRDGYEATRTYVLNPEPEPEPTGDCRINVVINNQSSRTLELNGELCMVLANPDKDGVYHGWDGIYNRTGHIRFADGVAIAPGNARTFFGVSMENSDVVVRGRNLVAAERVPETGRPSNVLLYNLASESDDFVPQPADSEIIFDDGVTLELVVME